VTDLSLYILYKDDDVVSAKLNMRSTQTNDTILIHWLKLFHVRDASDGKFMVTFDRIGDAIAELSRTYFWKTKLGAYGKAPAARL
jgi:hypothetical protein